MSVAEPSTAQRRTIDWLSWTPVKDYRATANAHRFASRALAVNVRSRQGDSTMRVEFFSRTPLRPSTSCLHQFTQEYAKLLLSLIGQALGSSALDLTRPLLAETALMVSAVDATVSDSASQHTRA